MQPLKSSLPQCGIYGRIRRARARTAQHDARIDVGGQGLFGHETTGVELQVTGNPTPNWRITASYSHSDPVEDYRFTEWLLWEDINVQFLSQFDQSIETTARSIADELDFIRENLAVNTAATGIGKLGTRHHKYNLFTRYIFSSGKLKGLYIGGGYRHQTKMFVGTDDEGNKLYGNSFWSSDALAGYTLRNLGRFPDIKLQLNVRNVFGPRSAGLALRSRPYDGPSRANRGAANLEADRQLRVLSTTTPGPGGEEEAFSVADGLVFSFYTRWHDP